MMQSLGRMYVRYFNYTYQRTGTLWEGRFKSNLVQSERYLLELYRYIELNPVCAGMVDEAGDYRWSSYRCNGLGVNSELRTPHQEYLALGKTQKERKSNYRNLFETRVETEMLEKIRTSVNKGLALGDESFATQIERLTSQRVTPGRRGRPKK